MGTENERDFLKKVGLGFQQAVLEVGSKNHGTAVPFRAGLDYKEYVGVDLEPGPGVDVVGDLSTSLCGLSENHFTLGICCSVLEHVARPWLMAQNVHQLLMPGGFLYVSVPWVWRYHAYPKDYWRMSWQGVQVLFPEIDWEVPAYSTLGMAGMLAPAVVGADDRRSIHVKGVKYLPYLQLHMIGRKR